MSSYVCWLWDVSLLVQIKFVRIWCSHISVAGDLYLMNCYIKLTSNMFAFYQFSWCNIGDTIFTSSFTCEVQSECSWCFVITFKFLWFHYLHHITSRWAAWKWSAFAWLIYQVAFCVVNGAQILNISAISLCCDVFNVGMWLGRNILNNYWLQGSCCHKMEPVSRS
jgi:hypothetical protein